jgi:energy-coupling factor transport system ATP-binding protein
LGLAKYKNKHPSYLSRGEKQRVTIAVSIVKNQDIQIFDEPTSGLDRENMEIVGEIISELKHAGKTVILISHDYEFIIKNCTRILMMENGKITDKFTLTDETKDKIMLALHQVNK